MKNEFLERMQTYLKSEYDDFIKSLDNPMYKGLTVNISKIKKEDINKYLNIKLNESPFDPYSFSFDQNLKLGNTWSHLSGLYYLQEPSASSVVEALDIKEGDFVFDTCAAPGGKSHQIASRLNNTGLLLSNEIDKKRALILMSNLERLGVSENIITNSSLEKLCPHLYGFFDKILVDAPCSGEGMMKKHELAALEWSKENNISCGQRQLHILDEVVDCLKEDGILVYSTCTYAIEENEAVIYEFLKKHPEMELLDAGNHVKRVGLPYQDLDYQKVRRIFPMDHGEGHFLAKMKKIGPSKNYKIKTYKESKIDPVVTKFLKDQIDLNLNLYINDSKIYAKKGPFIDIGVPFLRQGLLVGELIKNRLEPHQHFYTSSLLMNHYLHTQELTDDELILFFSGNVIPTKQKGYITCTYKNIPIGFGKADGTIIKNKYPKGLRTNIIL